jgi:hypothetical protein
MTERDKKEFLQEREAIRIIDGGQSEAQGIREAQYDLTNYLSRETKPETENKYGYEKIENNPFEKVKAQFRSKGTE